MLLQKRKKWKVDEEKKRRRRRSGIDLLAGWLASHLFCTVIPEYYLQYKSYFLLNILSLLSHEIWYREKEERERVGIFMQVPSNRSQIRRETQSALGSGRRGENEILLCFMTEKHCSSLWMDFHRMLQVLIWRGQNSLKIVKIGNIQVCFARSSQAY